MGALDVRGPVGGVMRKPRLVTVCVLCRREDVGVVRDVGFDGTRWRMARHCVEYNVRRGRSAICPGSRIVVPDDVVFPNEEGSQ